MTKQTKKLTAEQRAAKKHERIVAKNERELERMRRFEKRLFKAVCSKRAQMERLRLDTLKTQDVLRDIKVARRALEKQRRELNKGAK